MSNFNFNPSSGFGDSVIEVSPKNTNYNVTDRKSTAYITDGVSTKPLPVIQYGVPHAENMSGDGVYPSSGGSKAFKITTHYPIYFDNIPDWIEIFDEEDGGIEEGVYYYPIDVSGRTLYFIAEENTGESGRTGVIAMRHELRNLVPQLHQDIELRQIGTEEEMPYLKVIFDDAEVTDEDEFVYAYNTSSYYSAKGFTVSANVAYDVYITAGGDYFYWDYTDQSSGQFRIMTENSNCSGDEYEGTVIVSGEGMSQVIHVRQETSVIELEENTIYVPWSGFSTPIYFSANTKPYLKATATTGDYDDWVTLPGGRSLAKTYSADTHIGSVYVNSGNTWDAYTEYEQQTVQHNLVNSCMYVPINFVMTICDERINRHEFEVVGSDIFGSNGGILTLRVVLPAEDTYEIEYNYSASDKEDDPYYLWFSTSQNFISSSHTGNEILLKYQVPERSYFATDKLFANIKCTFTDNIAGTSGRETKKASFYQYNHSISPSIQAYGDTVIPPSGGEVTVVVSSVFDWYWNNVPEWVTITDEDGNPATYNSSNPNTSDEEQVFLATISQNSGATRYYTPEIIYVNNGHNYQIVCERTFMQDSVYNVRPNTVYIDASGGSRNDISVITPIPWSASTNDEWITVVTTSGDGGTNELDIAIDPTPNTGRTGTVVVHTAEKDMTVTVVQSDRIGRMNLSPNPIYMDWSGSVKAVSVECTAYWTSEENQGWLSISPTSGVGWNITELTTTDNNSLSSRTGYVYFTPENAETQVLEVIQRGITYNVFCGYEEISFWANGHNTTVCPVCIETDTKFRLTSTGSIGIRQGLGDYEAGSYSIYPEAYAMPTYENTYDRIGTLYCYLWNTQTQAYDIYGGSWPMVQHHH